MIRFDDIRIEFPDKALFHSLKWHVRPGERIGLVGDNGSGKTTLMRLMVGELEPDTGEIRRSPRIRIGYLPQDFGFSSRRPLLEVVLEAAGDLRRTEREIRELQELLQDLPPDSEDASEALARLGRLQEDYENRDGFRVESRARRILGGLGFAPDDAERPLDTFSGGWQMRAAMARLLLSAPDLLLLDEPTNHLDTDALEWLERFLRDYEGTVVAVSHDRFFLDRVVRQIVEIDRLRLAAFKGNYTGYRRHKEERRARRLAEFEHARERVREIQRFIDRFRYKASKARQVQSRIKQLEKMELPEVEREQGGVRFSFPPCERSGDIALTVRGLSKDYGRGRIFEPLDFILRRGERVALVGPNGAGKSTLVRLIAGLETPSEGEYAPGHKVRPAVYTQESETSMDAGATVLEILDRANRGLTRTQLRSLLGCFLFSGESVFKKVGVLSGGEKSRLAVARLLLSSCNFLVLDEPTNHLDLKAKDVLQRALAEFAGTVLVVSHDRYFLDGVVSRVLELREGRLADVRGNYSEFLDQREQQESAAAPVQTRKTAEDGPPARPRSRRERKRATAEKIRVGRILREHRERAEDCERRIAASEERMAELEAELVREEVYGDPEKMKAASVEYSRLREKLGELYRRWEAAQEELERRRAELDVD